MMSVSHHSRRDNSQINSSHSSLVLYRHICGLDYERLRSNAEAQRPTSALSSLWIFNLISCYTEGDSMCILVSL